MNPSSCDGVGSTILNDLCPSGQDNKCCIVPPDPDNGQINEQINEQVNEDYQYDNGSNLLAMEV